MAGTKARNLEYWKNNAEEDYLTTPISVLRYITELEGVIERSNKLEQAAHETNEHLEQ